MIRSRSTTRNQNGYMLLAVMLLIAIMLAMLAIEAPRIAQKIKRDKEQELINRGTEYAKAIKKYFHKTGNYPTSLEQLEDTNHIRFLRKKYVDPMTGEANWKVVHAGEAQIKLPQTNNPGLQGSGNPGLSGSSTGPTGQPSPSGTPTGNASLNGNGGGAGFGPSGQLGGNSLGSLATNGVGGTGQQIGGGGIIGVVSVSKDSGIKEFNDSNQYNKWMFVFDPRLEQSTAVFGGSALAGIQIAGPTAAATANSDSNSSGNPSASPSPNPSPSPTPGVR